jgi:hypothetical protein
MNWSIVGDVAAYYLPWVPFLMNSWNAVPHLQNEFNFRFIVLERPVEDVVTSYLSKFKKNNNNPLQNHQDPNLVVNEWDASFPKYDGVTLEEAIRSYCTDYYARCHELQNEYPSNVKIFNFECLNTEDGVASILKFAGVNDPRIITGITRNAS